MKKLYFLLFTLISFASFGQIINEFQPNAAGADPDPMPVELKGTVGASFSGFLVSIESDGVNGTVDRSAAVSGTFDANGLLVVNIPDLENPSFTFVLCSLDPVLATDLDADNDGAFDDVAVFGTVYDAIGIPDNDADAVVTAGYATQLGGVSFAYTGDEPGLVFRDGTTDDWFALNEPYDDTTVYDISANTVFAANFNAAPALAGTFGAVNPIYTAPTEPSIIITSPTDGNIFAPGTTTVSIDVTVANFIVANGTGDGHIRQILTTPSGTFDEFKYDTTSQNVSVADGESFTIFMELVDNTNTAIVPAVSVTVNFSVASTSQVATIAELRAGTIGQVYELTGEALLTYQQSFRNQKFIEDPTGAILIDDSPGNITTTYAIGDGISSITGTLGEFGGMMQFAPTGDPGAASSTGNTLTPQTVTLAMLTANSEQYESELVQVIAVDMDNSIETTFSTGTEYAMTQGGDNYNFRTSFFSADYIGFNVPVTATDIVGIINERSGNAYFLTARDANDFSVELLSIDDLNANTFSVYPNPTSTGFVNVVGTNDNAISISVYDILGKRVINETLTNNRINVSALNAGLYIVKISQNDASVTKKLVIK